MQPASTAAVLCDESDAETSSSRCYSSPRRRGCIQKRCAAVDPLKHNNNVASVQLLLIGGFASKYADPRPANTPYKQDPTEPLLCTDDSHSIVDTKNTACENSSPSSDNPRKLRETMGSPADGESRKLSSQSISSKGIVKSSSYSSNPDQNEIVISSPQKTKDTNKSRKSPSKSTKSPRDSIKTQSSSREEKTSSTRRRDKSGDSRMNRDEHCSGSTQGESMQEIRAKSSERTSKHKRTSSEDSKPRSPEQRTKRFTERTHIRRTMSEDSGLLGPLKRTKWPTVRSSTEVEAWHEHSFNDERTPHTSEKRTNKSVVHQSRREVDDDESHKQPSPRKSTSLREKTSVQDRGARATVDRSKSKETLTPKTPSKVQSQRDPSLTPRRFRNKSDGLLKCLSGSPSISPGTFQQRGRLQEQPSRIKANERSRSDSRKTSVQDLSFPLTPGKQRFQPPTELGNALYDDRCSSSSSEADTELIQFDPSHQVKGSCPKEEIAQPSKSEVEKMPRRKSNKTSKKVKSSSPVADDNELSDFSDASTSRKRGGSRIKSAVQVASTKLKTFVGGMNGSGSLLLMKDSDSEEDSLCGGKPPEQPACTLIASNSTTACESEADQTPRRKALKDRLDFGKYFRNSFRSKTSSAADAGYDSEASSCSNASSVSKRSLFRLPTSHLLLGGGQNDNDIAF